MESLETRLRSWRPRRPRPALERRLFGRAAGRPGATLWRAGWLAPAAAGVGLVGLLVNPPGAPTFSTGACSNGWVEVVLSNQSYVPYLPGSFQRAHNQLEVFAGTLTVAAAINAAP